MQLSYSFIIPVYNRPQEIEELLSSFLQLKTEGLDYEIIIVEDGSSLPADKIVANFKNKLPLSYYTKENSGPGDSRNFGMKKARGNYFIILDSDVLLPENYLQNVHNHLTLHYVDCFGGADAAHVDFTPVQKAINFAMTSFLTTGGIRGNKKSVENFKPRSFNMGISKKAFQQTKGFSRLKVGEDLDLSIRIKDCGFKIDFIPDAFVYHKRRSTWKDFYKQVSKFGMGRPILNYYYPKNSSLFFWLPSLFLIGFVFALLFSLIKIYFIFHLYILYFLFIFIFSSLQNKSIVVGLYSIFAVGIQFFGYGLGFLKSYYQIIIKGKNPKQVFPELYY